MLEAYLLRLSRASRSPGSEVKRPQLFPSKAWAPPLPSKPGGLPGASVSGGERRGINKTRLLQAEKRVLKTKQPPLNMQGEEAMGLRVGTVMTGRVLGQPQRAAHPEPEPSRTIFQPGGGTWRQGQGRGSPLGTSSGRIHRQTRRPRLRTSGWCPGPQLSPCGLACGLACKAGSHVQTDSSEADTPLPETAPFLQGRRAPRRGFPGRASPFPSRKWRSVRSVRVPGASAKRRTFCP